MATTIGFSQQVKSKMEFTVAMDNPSSHTYQVSDPKKIIGKKSANQKQPRSFLYLF